MSFKTDAEIARSSTVRPIDEITVKLGLNADNIEPHGHYKTKINPTGVFRLPQKQDRLALATATNPTPTDEDKTTVIIDLADALRHIGKNAVIALREPSLGPVFGVKSGVAGGSYTQVLPMGDINLHFTDDFHAIGAANNLLAAMLNNRIYQDSGLSTDPERVLWRHVVDISGRQLRNIIDGMGKPVDGVMRPDGFDITATSEVMAVFCLAKDINDLRERLGNILVTYAKNDSPVYARDLKTDDTMAALLKDTIEPNLIQTIGSTPAFVHGGPFANIAYGCDSATVTRLAEHLTDYAVIEAGLGAGSGAEKLRDIKCRLADLKPDAATVMATVRALEYNGGVKCVNLGEEDPDALAKGLPSLLKHISNLKNVFGLPVMVATNHFVSDSDAELAIIERAYTERDVKTSLTEIWGKGGVGGADLAHKVANTVEDQPNSFGFAYDTELSIKGKARAIAQKVYGAEDVDFSAEVSAGIVSLEKLGLDKMSICMAKTQYSLSDNAKLLGYLEGFRITVRGITVFTGAGFIVASYGNTMKMPGLPRVSTAEKIDVNADGVIHDLF